MEPLSKELKHEIHKRMLRFYAVSIILKEKNFARFLKNYIFPNINPDRPYEGNIADWKTDCYIKRNPDRCFKGFVKTIEYIGKEKFAEQAKEAIKEVDDIGSMASYSGRFKIKPR
jgi:hypothetical protein